ncbi:MAG: uracil-DNA glycosylase [Pseudomonadota bacterium]
MSKEFSQEEAIAALRFLASAGVTRFVGDEPVNRFTLTEEQNRERRDHAAPPPPPPASAPPRAPSSPPAPEFFQPSFSPDQVPDNVAAMDARTAAQDAKDLDVLREVLAAFDGCSLKKTATKLVFGDGNPKAKVMLIGEAPGRDEDLQGLPFVGRSGQLLDRMLAAIHKTREDVYITNILPWRPPGNRKPTPVEAEICAPFLARHVELVEPEIIVALGDTAARNLFALKIGITKARGKWYDVTIGKHAARGFATFHPAFLLRSPGQKRLVWQDLLTLEENWPGVAA